MLKLLLKIWPAITPILIYFFWIMAKRIARNLAIKKVNKIIDGEFFEVNDKGEKIKKAEEKPVGDFSLKNRHFIITLYLSFFIAILCFLFFAIRVPKVEHGKYVPPHMENGKVIPGKVIEIE